MEMYLSKDKILLPILFIMSMFSWSQQAPQFSNYKLNGFSLNPGYAGSKLGTEVISAYRSQWTAFDGGPNTIFVGGHCLLPNQSNGLGFVLSNDYLGGVSNLSLQVAGSYKFRLPSFSVNLGLSGGFSHLNVDLSSTQTVASDDPVFVAVDGVQRRTLPLIGLGVFVYNNSTYFGLSVPNTIQENTVWGLNQQRHYYSFFGKVFSLVDLLEIKPSVLIKYTKHAPLQVDGSFSIIYSKKLLIGVSHRTAASFNFFGQYFYDEKWTFGYAYDFFNKGLSGLTGNTHEVTISVHLSRAQEVIYSPRYF